MPKFRFVLFFVAVFAAGALAQSPKGTPVDPSEKVRNIKSEPGKVYKNWVEKDVDYIITPEEKKAFKALATDEERENFIENFWRRRDPNPDAGSSEREFQAELQLAHRDPRGIDRPVGRARHRHLRVAPHRVVEQVEGFEPELQRLGIVFGFEHAQLLVAGDRRQPEGRI